MKTTHPGTIVLLTCLTAGTAIAQPPGDFSDGKVSFAVKVRGEVTEYRVLAVSVLPEAALSIQVVRPAGGDKYEATGPDGKLQATGESSWEWQAPAAKGLYPLTIRSVVRGETMRLNVFVIVPLSRVKDGSLNGYRIGAYPTVPLRGLKIYRPPRGFIEVTPDNIDTQVSPHFTLRQFLCKQAGDYPKYLILRERLLLKLELLLQQFNAAGYRAAGFQVMSGYRTPFYNRSIGNVKYSRHVYGGAADIFVDENPTDGAMDDLNKDGKIDVYDAAVLYDLIDGLYGKDSYERFVGGLGRYKKTASHPPFVHVDVRGFRARWGD